MDMGKMLRITRRLTVLVFLFYIFTWTIINSFELDILDDNFVVNSINNEYNHLEKTKPIISKTKAINSIIKSDTLMIPIFSENSTPTNVDEQDEEPLVYIYNTHPDEKYNSLGEEILNSDVILAAYLLKNKLEKYKISTIVETANVGELLALNQLPYSHSYRMSRPLVQNAKDKYPSIKIFIDIHRDSQPKNITTTNIDGVSYARVMFVIGKEHAGYLKNYEIANRLTNIIESIKPTMTRDIYFKDYTLGNGIYNQDIDENVCLIEVGGYQNSIQEIENTIEVLAEAIYQIVKGDSNE